MLPLTLEDFLQLKVLTYMLMLTRITGLLMFAPVFSSRAMPTPFRFYMAFPISIMLFGIVESPPSDPGNLIDLVVMLFGELMIGLILGGFLQIVFQALQLAGQAAGQQLGLALANVINPQFDEQVSTTAVVFITVASMIFFGIGAHRELFRALLETFGVLPLGTVFLNESLIHLILELFHQSMIFAVRVAAPVTVALLLTELALGLIGKTVPQMNILSVGFGLRLSVGLLVTMLSIGGVARIVPIYIEEAFDLSIEALRTFLP